MFQVLREHVAVMFITAGLLFNMMNPSFSHPCSSRLKEGKVHDGQIVVQCIEYNKLRYINVIGTATIPTDCYTTYNLQYQPKIRFECN